jgi:hypothetical protein
MYREKAIPYTTKTGVQIGCMYQPKPNYAVSRDMERLQASLLSGSQVQKPGLLDRIGRYVNNIVRTDV